MLQMPGSIIQIYNFSSSNFTQQYYTFIFVAVFPRYLVISRGAFLVALLPKIDFQIWVVAIGKKVPIAIGKRFSLVYGNITHTLASYGGCIIARVSWSLQCLVSCTVFSFAGRCLLSMGLCINVIGRSPALFILKKSLPSIASCTIYQICIRLLVRENWPHFCITKGIILRFLIQWCMGLQRKEINLVNCLSYLFNKFVL